MMRILIRDWSGLTLPSALTRCMRQGHCPGHLSNGPPVLDTPGGIMLVDLAAQVRLDGADGPWPQISPSNGVADDASHQAASKGGLMGRGVQSCEDVTLRPWRRGTG
jgi:hypothetical protein